MDLMFVAQIATLALVMGGGAVVLVAARRFRKHRAILERVGARHCLAIASKSSHAALAAKVGRFEGRDVDAKLGHVLCGRGESAGVILADRNVANTTHTLLFFSLERPAPLDGFFVRPEEGDELQLHWRGPRTTWNDQRALSMGARVMYNLATVGEREGSRPLGLEVQGDRVWIHSPERLRGAALESFVNDAMRLRTMLMRSLERATSGPVPPVRGAKSTGLPTVEETAEVVTVLST